MFAFKNLSVLSLGLSRGHEHTLRLQIAALTLILRIV